MANSTMLKPLDADVDSLLSRFVLGKTVTVYNYNDYTDSGFYAFHAQLTPQNAPNPSVPGRWYNGIVINCNGEVLQIVFNTDNNANYIRSRTTRGVWSAWKQI